MMEQPLDSGDSVRKGASKRLAYLGDFIGQ